MLDNYTNIAIFGIDNRSSGNYESGNSDCIMIASINDDTKEVKLVSVYRDSFLAVDDKDSLRKLNAAYAKGGPTGAVAALNKNLDLNITEYVSVDFNAVMEVVDALGGIELDITKEEASNMHIWIDEMNEVMGTHGKPVSGPGVQQVNGIQALAYCRDRMSGGDDFRRTERQRIVVGKIVEKAKNSRQMAMKISPKPPNFVINAAWVRAMPSLPVDMAPVVSTENTVRFRTINVSMNTLTIAQSPW